MAPLGPLTGVHVPSADALLRISTTLAAVDPRYKKINPKMQECAELLGIPKDATMDMAMKMLAHTISEEGVTGEQMKAAMEELQIGVGDGFEDEWT